MPDVSQIGYRNRRDVTSSFRVVHRRRRGRDRRRLQHRKHHRRIRRYNIQGMIKACTIYFFGDDILVLILGERWPTSNITWSLRRPSPNLKVEELRRELAAALEMWRYACYEPTFYS